MNQAPRRISRAAARSVACPACGAHPGNRCIGSLGQLRTANHQERVDVALGQLQTRSERSPAPNAPSPANSAQVGDRFEDTVKVLDSVSVSQESNWAVLVAADGNGDPIRLVGTYLKRYREPGRTLHIQGRWRRHPQHGLQVAVTLATPVIPCSPDDQVIEQLRRVPHVGLKRARLLVERYGRDAAIARIDQNPRHAFARVAGLPFNQASVASAWWRARRLR